MSKRYSYPAIFHYDTDGISISFPDLPMCLSCGENIEDAVYIAKDALLTYILAELEEGHTLPRPTSFYDVVAGEGEEDYVIPIWCKLEDEK